MIDIGTMIAQMVLFLILIVIFLLIFYLFRQSKTHKRLNHLENEVKELKKQIENENQSRI